MTSLHMRRPKLHSRSVTVDIYIYIYIRMPRCEPRLFASLCSAIIVERPIKDTPNKGHLSIRDKTTPIIPVHFNLQIQSSIVYVLNECMDLCVRILCVCVWVYISVYGGMVWCVCVCMCVCVCVCVCVHVWYECMHIVYSCSKPMQNFMVFNDTDGVYTYTFEAEKKEDCMSCSTRPITLTFTSDTTLQQLYDYLIDNDKL